jgi:hypothetical protein
MKFRPGILIGAPIIIATTLAPANIDYDIDYDLFNQTLYEVRLPADSNKQLKIKDHTKGYFIEGGKIISPVTVYDSYFFEGGSKFPAIDFTQVVDEGDYYGFCVSIGGRDRTCGISEYRLEKAEDKLTVKLTEEEKSMLLAGERVCGEVHEVLRDSEPASRKPWRYPVCFELKR